MARATGSNTGSSSDLDLDRQLCFALYAASRAVTHAYGPLLSELGLTYPQYIVMLVLWEHDADGDGDGDGDLDLTVGTIGQRLRLDAGTLSPLLKRLEAAGLIERTRDAADERRVLVRLTEAGRALRARAQTIPRQLVRSTGLSASDVEGLRRNLVDLLEHLDAGS